MIAATVLHASQMCVHLHVFFFFFGLDWICVDAVPSVPAASETVQFCPRWQHAYSHTHSHSLWQTLKDGAQAGTTWPLSDLHLKRHTTHSMFAPVRLVHSDVLPALYKLLDLCDPIILSCNLWTQLLHLYIHLLKSLKSISDIILSKAWNILRLFHLYYRPSTLNHKSQKHLSNIVLSSDRKRWWDIWQVSKLSSSSTCKAHTFEYAYWQHVCDIKDRFSWFAKTVNCKLLYNMNQVSIIHLIRQMLLTWWCLIWGVTFHLVSSYLQQSSNRRSPPHLPHSPAAAEDSCRKYDRCVSQTFILSISPFISRVIDGPSIVILSCQELTKPLAYPSRDRGRTSSPTFNKWHYDMSMTL